MPPSWSTRLLSSGNSNSSRSAANDSNNHTTAPTPLPARVKDKALPPPPPAESTQTAFDPPPTLHHPERAAPTPPRPKTAGNGSRNYHNRSASHPLPKIFGRRKSARDLFHATDVPLEDDLVPVLDEAHHPKRIISGRKGVKLDDEENKIARRCMCCDSKVSVPKELDKFRCLACLTINDLKPKEEQKESDGEKGQTARAFPAGLSPDGQALPLSLDRTRAVIDRCVASYLEARCRRPVDHSPTTGRTAMPPLSSPPTNGFLQPPPNGLHEQNTPTRESTDSTLASSPPVTVPSPEPDVAVSASITNLADMDAFSYMRIDTPPPNNQRVVSATSRETTRKPVPIPIPTRPDRMPPPPPGNSSRRGSSHRLASNGSMGGHGSPRKPVQSRSNPSEMDQRRRYERVKTIFRPLEDYILATYGEFACLNSSFSTLPPTLRGRTRSESNLPSPQPDLAAYGPVPSSPFDGFSELDAKTLLLGDLGENSSWWTGKLDKLKGEKSPRRKKVGEGPKRTISSRSPNVNWTELEKWYEMVNSAGKDWQVKSRQLKPDDSGFSKSNLEGPLNVDEINDDLHEAKEHAMRALLKVTENILKRPTRPLKDPEHLRFLLIILANPSLYPSGSKPQRSDSGMSPNSKAAASDISPVMASNPQMDSPGKVAKREGNQHTGILKRIFGLLAHSSDTCHRYLVGWFSRFDESQLVRIIDLNASFVTYRIGRCSSGRNKDRHVIEDNGLIPDLSGSAMNTSAQLRSAMGLGGSVKKRTGEQEQETEWSNDWQIKAGAKLMSLLFAANNMWHGKPRDADSPRADVSMLPGLNLSPAAKAKRSGQLLHTSSFYNTLLDYHNLIADFKVWESKRDKFAFCQYPLFLSMGAKIKILEYDARRQMESKAREAYFDQVIRQRAIDGYFHLRIRRECMVDDSLRQISEAVGTGQEELKKGLRVHFTGEEGVDAGGPRKEWFLMLVRDIFDPNHGMFVYDDESHTCYFNPNSFETSDQYYLVGALLGLAIYNSTILDIALPPFAFRKLLAAVPYSSSTNSSNLSLLPGAKGQMTYTLADLAEFRPSLAAGLQQLLDFDGDVEATYCRDFVAPVERYGTLTNIPLIPNGDGTPVTNANRHAFVDAYVRFLLDTSIARQFEPFKRGFYTVCAGNALSLFRAEEIELLVRGSDEALDVDSLRAVAVYENWRADAPPHAALPRPADSVPVLIWFWDLFAGASPERQRKLLTFITGTDRIPAVGATSLILRIVAGGDGLGGGGREGSERFPVARTCFNMLVLWPYESREVLQRKLWMAVEESEGFGLK